jgi:uncharacterized UBP type Zn finger protein
MEICKHLQTLKPVPIPRRQCDECVKTGNSWVHLRLCLTCGAVHCCDSSPNRHATKHFHASGHPVVISAEPGERWAWCYDDEMFVEY